MKEQRAKARFKKHERVFLARKEDDKMVIGRIEAVHKLPLPNINSVQEWNYDVDYMGVDGQMAHWKNIKADELHSRMQGRNEYEIIFDRLEPILEALDTEDAEHHAVKLESKGWMDLHVDLLRVSYGTGERTVRISLAHYFEQNGDQVPDPDMEIRIYPERWQAEALTFQNALLYQEVYMTRDGKDMVYPTLKKQLNRFLRTLWLPNIKKQGFLKHAEQISTERILGITPATS